MDFRIGHGFDTHRLEAGEGVSLGGVHIPCAYRIVAHSDGDVLIHALCDALLGATGGGDIGKLFPDNDPQYQGIDSRELLAEVMRRVRAAGFGVVNADLTLIAEAPRVAAHVPAMRAALASELGIEDARVNVKATTNETMGALGRREGLAAHAVVLLGPAVR
ncbi:MAG TPA: 2-C-methyl-D-erythritol 2,4-cyclodiphosphate synthase [Solimonas sp.]